MVLGLYDVITQISIHASAREATLSLPTFCGGKRNFNPRLREGGDLSNYYILAYFYISIHASAREATLSLSRLPGL